MGTFLHNPHSPLSRRVLGSLDRNDRAIEVIDVVEAAPDTAELAHLAALLPVEVRELLDRSGPLYFALGLDDPHWSDAEVMAAAFDNPSLLRCPILITGDRVRVAEDVVEDAAGIPPRRHDADPASGFALAEHG
jgi:arsenate reductase